MSKRDRDREISRRALIKWSLAAGAALGVSRARILDVLETTGGKGIAEAAALDTCKRSVHLRGVNGGLAWFQLLWPHNDVARAITDSTITDPNDPAHPLNFALHRPGPYRAIAGTGGKLTVCADTPFQDNSDEPRMTAFMAGHNETHTNKPKSIAQALNGDSLFAMAAALRSTHPSTVPVIAVRDSEYGVARDAPGVAVVPTGDAIVDLFNSAASRAGGLLATTSHADLYRARYTTLAALNRAAERSTARSAYAAGRSAARLLGTNLADRLQITDDDKRRYRITDAMRPDVAELGRTLIITAKAFQMGLTSSVILPALRDDPHGAFTQLSRDQLLATTAGLKSVLDGFLSDLASTIDSVTKTSLSENIVITIDGDTPKAPLKKSGWPDETPGNSNWMYVYGGGKLKTGWFGGIDRNGVVTGFNPTTGGPAPYDGDLQAKAACAAVVYAVTRGDMKAVRRFSSVDISGIVV